MFTKFVNNYIVLPCTDVKDLPTQSNGAKKMNNANTLKVSDIADIYILGRRWFQKTYGNTYHSVTIRVKNIEVAYIPFTYGFGNQFEVTAKDWLVENGFINRTDSLDKAFVDVEDVQRKKDL